MPETLDIVICVALEFVAFVVLFVIFPEIENVLYVRFESFGTYSCDFPEIFVMPEVAKGAVSSSAKILPEVELKSKKSTAIFCRVMLPETEVALKNSVWQAAMSVRPLTLLRRTAFWAWRMSAVMEPLTLRSSMDFISKSWGR